MQPHHHGPPQWRTLEDDVYGVFGLVGTRCVCECVCVCVRACENVCARAPARLFVCVRVRVQCIVACSWLAG